MREPSDPLPGGNEKADLVASVDNRFLQSIVQNIPNMVFVKDAADLRFVFMNDAGSQLLGVPADRLVGRNDYDFFPEEEADFFTANDRRVLDSGVLLDVPRETINTRNGERILHTKKIPVVDADGKAQYLLGISEDITEMVETASGLDRAREDAEAAIRARSELLSRVSHELRTPLNAILGFTQLLRTNDDPATRRDYVDHIADAGKQLLDLVNDVLDISGIQSGEVSLDLRSTGVAEIIDSALNLLRPLALELKVSVPDGFTGSPHLAMMGDASRLRQIVVNILANAIQYNRPGGSVSIDCERVGNHIEIAISDTGIGIEPSKMSRLFRPFDRLGAESTTTEGTGLGLAVAKQLCDAMHASIRVNSQPTIGSTFVISVPAAASSDDTIIELDEPRRTGSTHDARVLYIEDNASNIKLMRLLLEPSEGVELLVAEDGETGVDAALSSDPDLVLLDLHLPGIGGDEVLQRLRDHPKTSDTPIVVVSADATPSRIRELRAMGANDYITKPFEISTILDVVEHHRRAPAR